MLLAFRPPPLLRPCTAAALLLRAPIGPPRPLLAARGFVWLARPRAASLSESSLNRSCRFAINRPPRHVSPTHNTTMRKPMPEEMRWRTSFEISCMRGSEVEEEDEERWESIPSCR